MQSKVPLHDPHYAYLSVDIGPKFSLDFSVLQLPFLFITWLNSSIALNENNVPKSNSGGREDA